MTFMLRIRLEVQRKFYHDFRVKIGFMRQERKSMEYDRHAIRIQELCGEIEQTLSRCQRML